MGSLRFCNSSVFPKTDSTDLSKDPALAKRLWDLSVELTGVDPGLNPL